MKLNYPIFEEKQFLGYNRIGMITRMILAGFCFLGYYWSENPKPVEISVFRIGSYPIENIEQSGRVFFFLGLIILAISILMMYVLHLQTRVYDDHIILDGFWGSRRVKIDLRSIHTVKKLRYKKNSFRRPVYNLYIKGIIKFYTSGDEFVEMKDKDGLTYRIGSQRAQELFRVINKQINIL